MALQVPRGIDWISPDGDYRWPSGRAFRLYSMDAGLLSLSTGRLVARDPFWLPLSGTVEDEVFTAVVDPGSYPAVLLMAEFAATSETPSWRGVAAIKVIITEGQVASWQLALRRSQDVSVLPTDAFFGFDVDSRHACVLDGSALPYLWELQEEESSLEQLSRRARFNGWSRIPDNSNAAEILIVLCATGDGAYPTFVGRDEDGQIVCFLVDLELLAHGAVRES